MNHERLKDARRLFFILLSVDVALTAIVGIHAFSTIDTLQDIQAGRLEVDESILSSFENWENLAKLTIVTLVGVGIGLVKWLNACYSHAKNVIGVSGLKNEGWTAGGWLIPIFNLFKPFQVISEIYKVGATNYTAPEGWKHESGSGALLGWWIFWIIAHLITWTMFRATMSSNFGESTTIQSAIIATQTQAWICLISLAVAGMWFWVGSLLTQRLLERRSLSADSPQPQIKPQSPMSSSAPIQPVQTRGNPPASPVVSKVILPTNSAPSQPKNLHSMSGIDEDVIYEIVGKEIEEGRTETGLWTRLFAEMNGDETKVKVAYIKRRAEKLIAMEQTRIQEQLRLEEEKQKAAQLAEFELEKAAAAAAMPVDQVREMLISAANAVRRSPNLRNCLAFLELKGEDVSFHSQGLFLFKYQMNRDGKTKVVEEHEIIRYAQELAKEFV